MNSEQVKVSIIIPCLNEERTVGLCIENAQKGLSSIKENGEIIIIDNGSTDASADIAKKLGARVTFESKRGYGSSLRRGIKEARGKYVIMGDADDTYDFSKIKPFVEKLEKGNDLVMGTRLKGNIKPGAMPFLHRFIGNPFLTFILNLFFKGKISDAHCGLRAFRKEAIERLNLHSNGMEFASEMIIKALINKLKIDEIPIEYRPSLAGRKPHLRTFRDGWRHLRFMLMFSPYFLFIIPGLTLFIFGFGFLLTVFFGLISIFNIPLGLSTMIFSLALILLGGQLIFLGISAKMLGYYRGFIYRDTVIDFIESKLTLEKGIITGITIFFLGFLLGLVVIYRLFHLSIYGPVDIGLTKLALISATMLLLGIQLIAFAFYLGLLDIKSTLE